MKKILLATTLLAASTSFAMADAHLAWSGSAAAGIAMEANTDAVPAGSLADVLAAEDDLEAAKTAYILDPSSDNLQAIVDAEAALAALAAVPASDNPMSVYSNASVDLTLSGSTDGGLTFGASFGASVGKTYTLADDDGFGSEDGSFGSPTMFISGSFGKLEFSDDNFDFADDSTTGDVKYSGKFGMFGVGVIADMESGELGFNTDFAIGAVSVTASADTVDHFDVGASFKVSDAITVSASTDENSDAVVGAAMTFGSISASADYNTSDDSIDLSLGYAANGLSANLDTNTVSESWTVTIGYDLGGGLALEAGTNYTGDMMVGATMAF